MSGVCKANAQETGRAAGADGAICPNIYPNSGVALCVFPRSQPLLPAPINPADWTPTAKCQILESPTYILRGYGRNDRIVYGTGAVVAIETLPEEAARRLADPRIAYVHVRSARNNCFQVRIDR